MNRNIQEAFERLRNLGTQEEMRELAGKMDLAAFALTANAHVHLPPNFSAFESVGQAVSLAADQGVRALGASNYYDFDVYGDFASLTWRHGVFPLFGLEVIALVEDLKRASVLVNDPGNPGRMYLCGKGITRFDPVTPTALDLLNRIRRNDADRMKRMVSLMQEVFGAHGVDTGPEYDEIIDKLADRYAAEKSSIWLQERHLARAFQEEFFVLVPPSERASRLSAVLGKDVSGAVEDPLKTQQEIRAALMKVGRPAYVAEKFVDFDQACRLILELGGIPCYPTLADGAKPICAYEASPEKLAETLLRRGIFCAEFIPIRNEPAVLERYVRTLRAAGFVVTGGTEHNTPDLLPLEPRCVRGLPVPPEIREIFKEGACVVAAHQFLTLHGMRGYVDEAGNLNGDFAEGEDRISFFARLGAAVIARYDEKSNDREGSSRNA